MLNLKWDHPFLCKLPILFTTVNLKLDIFFPNSCIDSKFGFWNVGWAVYTSKFFPIHESDGLGVLKSLGYTTKFFPL